MSWLGRLFRQTAPERSPEADLDLARDLAEAGDYEAALALWHPLARAGHARAQNNIGACFAEGLGVEKNGLLAMKWLSLAAEAGDPVGQRNLAALLFKGEGVEPDFQRALSLYRTAAEQGDAPAQDMLSWMLLEGEEIAADPAEARLWAEKAAAAGIASAMTRIGMLHHNALGVPRDPAEAASWWRRGAEVGDADGAAMLGAALVLGQGATRDPEQGLVWLLRAQAGGSALCAPFFPAARAALDEEAQARAARAAAERETDAKTLPPCGGGEQARSAAREGGKDLSGDDGAPSPGPLPDGSRLLPTSAERREVGYSRLPGERVPVRAAEGKPDDAGSSRGSAA